MKIRIQYAFNTDGDFSLTNPEEFGCTGQQVLIPGEPISDSLDYVGAIDFTNEEPWRCKLEAKNFLQRLLCDGLHISYTHYCLIESFYQIIDALIEFINKNNDGFACQRLTGNYEDTMISVEFMD